MADEREDAVKVIEAHQDLVAHLERTSGRMRALSIFTATVAAFFVLGYAFQILLTLSGTKSVLVDLTDPANQVVEVFTLALALVWLYIGARDYLFASRISRVVGKARMDERELKKRLPSGEPE